MKCFKKREGPKKKTGYEKLMKKNLHSLKKKTGFIMTKKTWIKLWLTGYEKINVKQVMKNKSLFNRL